jgi:NTE family protein
VTTDAGRALVLGGGGVLGFAWSVGALRAWQDHTGIDPRRSELILGTSAGSVLGTLLACGVSVDVIERHHQGVPLPADPGIEWTYEDEAGALPPWPGWRPGSPRRPAIRCAAPTIAGCSLARAVWSPPCSTR